LSTRGYAQRERISRNSGVVEPVVRNSDRPARLVLPRRIPVDAAELLPDVWRDGGVHALRDSRSGERWVVGANLASVPRWEEVTMPASRSLRIHGPRGIVERAIEAIAARLGVDESRTESTSITDIMSRDVVCAFPELAFEAMLEVMLRERLGSVPVVDEGGGPIGMVTKLDVVEYLAAPADRLGSLVSDIMMPLAITLRDDATVADAATLMASEDMHHVLVVSGRQLVGVVSTMDVTRWLASSIERRR